MNPILLRTAAAKAKRLAIDSNDADWLAKLNEIAPDVEPEPWKPSILDVLRERGPSVPWSVRIGKKP